MNPSVSPLPEDVRSGICDSLQALLIDLITINLLAHEAHVNTAGSQFVQVHALFGDLYTAAEGQLDPLAERISLLGGTARMSNVALLKSAAKPRLPQKLPETDDGLSLCSFLFALVQKFGATIGPFTIELGSKDPSTQNLLIGVWDAVAVPGWKIGKMAQSSVK